MKSIYTCLFILLSLCLIVPNLEASKLHPLEAADTSSPQATFKSFQSLFLKARPILDKIATSGFAPETVRALQDRRKRAIHCVDLSKVGKRLRDDAGPEAVILLAEILARIELPPFEAVPDAQAMKSEGVSHWKIPHTNITIGQVKEGPRQGEYLFTPETVAQLKKFFAKVKNLPYLPDSALKKIGPAGGLYDYYCASPRGLIPMSVVMALPSWARTVYSDHPLWQWIGMVLAVLIGIFVIVLIRVLVNKWTKSRSEAGKEGIGFARLILPVSAAIIIRLTCYIIDEQIGMSGTVYQIVEVTAQVLVIIFGVWFTVSCGGIAANIILASPKIDPKGVYAGLTKVLCYLFALAVAFIIIFKGLTALGVPMLPIVTSLGVGGFAVALAARPTLENLIGGLMILADRPFKIGQRIKVKDHDGIVQRLGMRSTQIRLLNGPQVKIPNEEMARVEIENVSLRPNLRRSANITIEYDTPIEKVEKAVAIVKDILKDHEGMDPKRPARVFFNDFNPDSLNISMTYWYHPAKLWKSKAFGEKVNFQLMREFEKEGIKFAFPTTTTYLVQEDGRPLYFTPVKDSSE
jgi:MscS family membrane protein